MRTKLLFLLQNFKIYYCSLKYVFIFYNKHQTEIFVSFLQYSIKTLGHLLPPKTHCVVNWCHRFVTETIVLAVRALTDICQYEAFVVDKVGNRSSPCQTPEFLGILSSIKILQEKWWIWRNVIKVPNLVK
jgi:hypothetical protein